MCGIPLLAICHQVLDVYGEEERIAKVLRKYSQL